MPRFGAAGFSTVPSWKPEDVVAVLVEVTKAKPALPFLDLPPECWGEANSSKTAAPWEFFPVMKLIPPPMASVP